MRSAVIACLLLYATLASLLELCLHRRNDTAQRFLRTNRDISAFITSLSYLAANCSALEVLTMIAISAKYGMIAVHFYWIGAVPALAYLLCVLLPRYQVFQVQSIPEYLERRYSPGTRLVSALAFSTLMVSISGITLSVTSHLIQLVLGCSLTAAIVTTACLACVFLLTGGLSAVLYAEAMQLMIFIVILVPLTVRIIREASGLRPVIQGLPASAQHAFRNLPLFSPRSDADIFGIVCGLGGVLSFTYWCSDFLLVQRLHAARSAQSALRTPVLTVVAKLFLPLILVLPGLWIRTRNLQLGDNFDLLLPKLLLASYSPLLAAGAVAIIIASLFLGLCGNIAAGVSIFTSDVQRAFLFPQEDPGQELLAGKWTTVGMVVASSASAFLALNSDAAMEKVQLVLSSFNVPVGIVFLAGISAPWLAQRAGLVGIIVGTFGGLLTWKAGKLFGLNEGLAHSFYTAVISGTSTILAMLSAHWLHRKSADRHAVYPQSDAAPMDSRPPRTLATFCLVSATALYVLFW